MSVTGATLVGNNQVKTTSTTPKMTFTGMSKYANVTRVMLELNSEISDPSSFKLKIDSRSQISASSTDNKTLIFYIEIEPDLDGTRVTGDTYEFTLGNETGKTYTINRIEVQILSSDLMTNHQVSVNLIPRKQVVQTTDYYFDSAWGTSNRKLYTVTSGSKTGTVKIKNDVPLESDPKTYTIAKGDATPPAVTFTQNPASTTWTNTNVTISGVATDSESGVVAYAWSTSSTINYYTGPWTYITKTSSTTQSHTVSTNGTYYLHVMDEAGNVSNNAITISNIDKLVPTCSAITGNNNQAILSCSDPEATTENGQSKIVAYYFGTKSSPVNSDYTSITATDTYSETKTVTAVGTYYLFVKDKAGSVSAEKHNMYYGITYSLNAATTQPDPKPTIVRYGGVATIGSTTNIAKKFTVNIDANSQGASIKIGSTSVTKAEANQTFAGWTYSNGAPSGVKYRDTLTGADNAWDNGSTKVNKKFFRNLKNTAENVTMTANWTAVDVTLPTVTKTGYKCGYMTSATETGDFAYASGASYTPSTTTNNVTLYVKCNPNDYKIKYDLDGGSKKSGNSYPTTAYFDTEFTVDYPIKSVKVSFDLGDTGATATTTPIERDYTFTGCSSDNDKKCGWDITGMDSVTHYYGNDSANTTSTSTSLSEITAKKFKNLTSVDGGEVTFKAYWYPPTIVLPKVEKTGYTCIWTSGGSTWTSGGTYKPSDSGGTTAITMSALPVKSQFLSI